MVAAAAARRRQVVVKACPEEPRLLADAADGRRALDVRRDPGHTLDGVARRFCGRVGCAAGRRAGDRAVVGPWYASQTPEWLGVLCLRRPYRFVRIRGVEEPAVVPEAR